MAESNKCSSCSHLTLFPRALFCQHIFCKDCLETLPRNGNVITCTSCNIASSVPSQGLDGLPTPSILRGVFEFLQSSEGEDICPHHHTTLDMYCTPCQTMFCDSCSSRVHRNHKLCNVKELNSQKSTTIAELDAQKKKLCDSVTGLKEKKKKITSQRESIRQQVMEAHQKMMAYLNDSVDRIKRDIDSAVEHKLSILDNQVTSATDAANKLDDCKKSLSTQSADIDQGQSILEQASIALMSVKRKSFVPLEHPDMQFSWEDLNSCIEENMHSITYNLHPSSVELLNDGNDLMEGQLGKVTLVFPHFRCGRVPVSDMFCRVFPVGMRMQSVITRVEATKSPNQFIVQFTPMKHDLHELHVFVSRMEIPSSSQFFFEVHRSPKSRKDPIKTFTGLCSPCGIDVTDSSDVVVTEIGTRSVTVLDSKGKSVNSFVLEGISSVPTGIACSHNGIVYVADKGRHCVQWYTLDGTCLGSVGSKGLDDLQFNQPMGIAINRRTNAVYVADTMNHRVQVLKPDLSFDWKFGSKGSGVGQFNEPHGIAVDSEGNIYVTDIRNERVQKFLSNGEHLLSFRMHDKMLPVGVVLERDKFVYVSDFSSNCVFVFSCYGQFVCRVGVDQSGRGIFQGPFHMAFDGSLLYVCDNKKDCIYVF